MNGYLFNFIIFFNQLPETTNTPLEKIAELEKVDEHHAPITSESGHVNDEDLVQLKKLNGTTVTRDELKVLLKNFNKMSTQARIRLVELLKEVQLIEPSRVDGLEVYLKTGDDDEGNTNSDAKEA